MTTQVTHQATSNGNGLTFSVKNDDKQLHDELSGDIEGTWSLDPGKAPPQFDQQHSGRAARSRSRSPLSRHQLPPRNAWRSGRDQRPLSNGRGGGGRAPYQDRHRQEPQRRQPSPTPQQSVRFVDHNGPPAYKNQMVAPTVQFDADNDTGSFRASPPRSQAAHPLHDVPAIRMRLVMLERRKDESTTDFLAFDFADRLVYNLPPHAEVGRAVEALQKITEVVACCNQAAHHGEWIRANS